MSAEGYDIYCTVCCRNLYGWPKGWHFTSSTGWRCPDHAPCPVEWLDHACRYDTHHDGPHVCACDETCPGDGEHYEQEAVVAQRATKEGNQS